MCGRFTLIRLEDFLHDLPWIGPPESPLPMRYNIAPSQPIAAVLNREKPRVEFVHWGLIPHWAKDPAIGNRMINARAEGLAEKPAFRTAIRRRRCIVPASGFYEWRKESGGSKTPLYIQLKSHKPLAFAGLWDVWHDPAGGGSEISSCTIITTTPNALMKTIHDRMPAILKPQDYRAWLAPEEKIPAELQQLLVQYPAEEMEMMEVGKSVNNTRNLGPECLEPPVKVEQPKGLFDDF